MNGPLPICFLSDYGHEDDFVGVCHGVIQRIAPGAVVIDVAHALPRHDIRTAALVLRNTLRFMPLGVHLAVVDPSVGSTRLPIAVECADGRLLVGPDNGLLCLAAAQSGGIERAADLSNSPFRLQPVSATFHGRDVLAPVAARLALGESIEDVGAALAPEGLVRLELTTASVSEGEVQAHVLYVDRFGNVQLDATRDQLNEAAIRPGSRLAIQTGHGRHEAIYGRTFADVPPGALLVYEDSYEAIAVAINKGSAAALLGLGTDAPLRLVRDPDQ